MKIDHHEIKSAMHIVQTSGNRSISHLQRKMCVGYEKARELMEIVEKELSNRKSLL